MSARLLSLLLGLALLAPLPVLAAGPALAAAPADPVPTRTTLAGAAGREGTTSVLSLRVATEDGRPVAGVPVVVDRRVGGTWRQLAEVVTGAGGAARTSLDLARSAADNVVRARYAGGDAVPAAPEPRAYGASASGPTQVDLVRRGSTLALSGPGRVPDGQAVTLRIVRRTGEGAPVPGWARLERRVGSRWATVRAVRLDADGSGTVSVSPRRDTRYRASAAAQDWVQAASSGTRLVDNVPPGAPVRLPRGAPRPRVGLPAQPRVAAAGARPVITRIPDGVWRSMVGRTWHRGCPVGRSGLRLLRVTYWGYDGYRHRGEMVVAAWAVRGAAGALTEMHDRRFPIRTMYRVDRFGWSRALRGGNDYRSMASGNTSGFNCRSVVNKPGVRSPHASGGAIDVNTWENPYRSRTGWVPNRWWAYRGHARVAWRSASHPVVRIWRRHGFRWSYGVGDSQHFDAIR